MASIEKFLGATVEIPEDRRYYSKQNLWGRESDKGILFGLTQPALVLMGGIKSIDWLLEDSETVQAGVSVAFAITGKILYIDTPLSGTIDYNMDAKETPELINTDPYGKGWLFIVQPEGDKNKAYQTLSPAEDYLESLRTSEGFKNPDGLKGGVSGICKAVYSGIGRQKI